MTANCDLQNFQTYIPSCGHQRMSCSHVNTLLITHVYCQEGNGQHEIKVLLSDVKGNIAPSQSRHTHVDAELATESNDCIEAVESAGPIVEASACHGNTVHHRQKINDFSTSNCSGHVRADLPLPSGHNLLCTKPQTPFSRSSCRIL